MGASHRPVVADSSRPGAKLLSDCFWPLAACGLVWGRMTASDPKETFAMFAGMSVKAIVFGILVVVLVGLLFSIAALPYETFLIGQFGVEGHSLGEVLDLMYWPAMAFIWAGIFVAFCLGSYVATRFSQSQHRSEWIAMVAILLAVVWGIDLAAANSNVVGPMIYSVIAVLAAILGKKLSGRGKVTSS